MVEKKETKRQGRYSEAELSLIKNTFNDETLLKILQKTLLGYDLTKTEAQTLSFVGKSDLLFKIISKSFKPELSLDVPFGENLDLLMTFKIEDKSVEDGIRNLMARVHLLNLLDKGLERVKTADMKGFDDVINFNYKRPVNLKILSEVYGRNTLINHVDLIINTLKALASQIDESENDKKRKQDSAK